MFKQLGLIGCGLMGGSFALALRRAGLVQHVVGYSKSPATLKRARELGVIDAQAPSTLQAVSGADIVLLAVPVSATESTLKSIRHLITRDMLVMDVGSTKQDVVQAARRVLKDELGSFVPCHPIAGKEQAGVDHADADLYRDRTVILTPIERTLVAQLERAQMVWRAVGARLHTMSPQAHDQALASVSHLPHLLAFAYIRGLLGQPHGQEFMALGGPGFRDFSRIAAGEPQIWRDILLANRHDVLAQSRLFRESLAQFEQLVEAGDAATLESLLRQASAARAGWSLGGPDTPPHVRD